MKALSEPDREKLAVQDLSRPDVERFPWAMLAKSTYGDAAPGYRSALISKAEDIASELAGPNPTAIESLLADRAAYCWMECHALDIRAAYALSNNEPLDVQAMRSKVVGRAHDRYLATLRTLAAVRRPVIVAMQVNVGEPRSQEVLP